MTDAPRRRHRVLRTLGLVVLALVVAAGGYLGYVGVRRSLPVTLPAPTGPYRVGRMITDWTDPARADPLAPRPGVRRRLSVWLWYPAARTGGRRAAYAPGAWAGLHVAGFPGLGETGFGAVRPHAYDGAPVAPGRFPVVVLEPGLGLAAPQYTTLAEDLASHGYLVAGVTPTYSANLTVLGGRPVRRSAAGDPHELEAADLHHGRAAAIGDRLTGVWAADARFAARHAARLGGRFAGHVRTDRTAYAGHSMGGAAALEACRTDRACAAAVDLDGTQFGPVVRRGLRVPALLMASGDSCVTGVCRPADAAARTDRATARRMVAAGTGPVWTRTLPRARHFDFSDYPAYYLAAPLRSLLPLGPADGARDLRAADAYVTAFLDHAVRGGRPRCGPGTVRRPVSRCRASAPARRPRPGRR